MAIDKDLQELSKKLKLRLNRQNSNFSFTLSQIRDEINKVSTDYANITFEQETLIVDNLINKSQSTIQQKSQCDLTETEDPTLKLDKQTLDNLTENNQGVTDMNDANNQQQSALTVNSQQSSAITFGDDIEKAMIVKHEAKRNNIELSRTQLFTVVDSMHDSYNSENEMMMAIVNSLVEQKIINKNQIVGFVGDKLMGLNETLSIENERLRQMVRYTVEKITEEHNQTARDIALSLAKFTLGSKAGEQMFKENFKM